MKHTLLWLAGGLSAASAIALAALGGFGVPGGDANQVYGTLGFDGLDNVMITDQGVLAVVLFVAGVGLMAAASSTAWKETGGY